MLTPISSYPFLMREELGLETTKCGLNRGRRHFYKTDSSCFLGLPASNRFFRCPLRRHIGKLKCTFSILVLRFLEPLLIEFNNLSFPPSSLLKTCWSLPVLFKSLRKYFGCFKTLSAYSDNHLSKAKVSVEN